MSSRTRRFERNARGRDFVVGDVHGHFDTLERLLEAVDFDASADRLFSVGDLVNRGPASERSTGSSTASQASHKATRPGTTPRPTPQ